MLEGISKGPSFGVRHIQCILLFFLNFLVYLMRCNISVAIVAMTKSTSSNPNVPYYNWIDKNVVLSSFFWGYIIPQIPAGSLGKKFGTKKLLLICMLTNSLMVLLIPIMAEYYGSKGTIACRVIQGLAQGFFYPLLSSVIGKWIPVEERARVSAFIFSGSTLGLVITYSLTGVLCKSSIGWPGTFYLSGLLGCTWFIFYYLFGSDDPASHKTITKEERFYIETSLGTLNSQNTAKTPWKAIFTSVPFWAIFVAYLGQGWGSTTVMTEMPTYFDQVLKFDISSNGVLSSLPYMISFFVPYLVGFTSDYLINNDYLSTTNVRKLFTVIGNFGTGTLLLIFGYLPEGTNRYISVAFLVFSVSAHVVVTSGYLINHFDLSPNFSGTLMRLVNEAEEILSIITPLAVQFIVTDETDRNQWKIIIALGTAMYFATAITFCIFAKAEKQWWDKIADEETEDNDVKKHTNDLKNKP